jgi:membrane-associated protease RseP (regulator of RpoE activity)/antitoxin component YwqK of YwqJK toxin-antitoxin module
LHGKTKVPEFSWWLAILAVAADAIIFGIIAAGLCCGLTQRVWGLWAGPIVAVAWFAWTVGHFLWRQLKCPPEGEVDEEGYRHGRWVWRDASGNVEGEFDYDHGQLHGCARTFHPSGTVAEECYYVHGKPHGPDRIWHTSGQLAVQSEYREGRREGLAAMWNAEGLKTFEGGFESGWAHGPWTWWHDNGERWIRAAYVTGTPSGKWTEWDEEGVVHRCAEFVAGVQQGLLRRYFEDQSSVSSHSEAFPPPLPQPAGRVRWLWWLVLALVIAALASDAYLLVPLALLIVAIFVHELGHLLAAKLVGIPIKRFRVGVGRKLWAFLYRGTVYEFCLVPLMGFVEECALRPCEWDHARAVGRARRRKEPEPPYPEIDGDESPRAGSYLVSPLKRMVYLLGGVVFNLIAAVLVLWGLRASDHPEMGASFPYGPGDAVVETAKTTALIGSRMPEILSPIFDVGTYTQYQPSMVGTISEKTRAAVESGPLVEAGASPPPTSAAPSARVPLADRLYFAGTEALWHFYVLSLVIALFNVLPVPPLDGFHCVAALAEMVLGESLAWKMLRPVYWLGGLVVAFLMLSGTYLIVRDLLAAIGRMW